MDLAKFNAMVRKWADQQPKKYRKSARAFGFPCDMETHSFSGTEKWIARHARSVGIDISESTIQRHLKDFEAYGVITVERRRDKDKNQSSIYHVHFDRFIGTGDTERDAFLTELAMPDRPALPPEAYQGHNVTTCPCEPCADYRKRFREWREAHSR